MRKRFPFLPKNWLRFGLAPAFATAFSLNLQAQNVPVKQWDKTFGGSAVDYLHIIKQTTDGGYILGAGSASGISGDKSASNKGMNDFWIIKLDASGNKTWDKAFGGNKDDVLWSLQQTSDGGYILGGVSKSDISGDKSQNSKGNNDYWVVKLDANGNKLWDKTYGGDYQDDLISLQQTSDGGYILGGYSLSKISGDKTQALFGINSYDYWVVKLDASGNKQWDQSLGGSENDALLSLQQTIDGGFVLGGTSWSDISGNKTQPSKGSADFWLIKLDGTGNKLWDKTFGGTGYDALYSLQQTTDGGFILGGNSASDISGDKSEANRGTTGSYDYWVIKLDGNGNKLWDKTLGGNAHDALYALKQTSDGGYILGGETVSGISGDKTQASRGDFDIWIVKLDTTGNKQWDKTFGGNNTDFFRTLQQTSDGGFIFGGASESGINGDKSEANRGTNGSSDCWIVKLGSGLTTPKPTIDCIDNIFPNPFQGKINLQFCNLAAPEAEIKVFDLVGRLILRQKLKITENQLSTELTLPVANEMYLLQVKAGQEIIIRKIMAR